MDGIGSLCDEYLNPHRGICSAISSLLLSIHPFILYSLIILCLYFLSISFCVNLSIMAPKKPEQKKETMKVSPEAEAAKEPDFDPHSIKVCMSVCQFCNANHIKYYYVVNATIS